MSKPPTAWSNIYGYVALLMGDTIFSRDGKHFTETECPTQGAWFGKFMIGYKLWMLVIKKQYFGVTSEIVKALLVRWYIEWKRGFKIRKWEISVEFTICVCRISNRLIKTEVCNNTLLLNLLKR